MCQFETQSQGERGGLQSMLLLMILIENVNFISLIYIWIELIIYDGGLIYR